MGSNPSAMGSNPSAMGSNPSAMGSNPSAMGSNPSCFLDGRYISVVLRDVPEFIPIPITVSISLDKDGNVVSGTVKSDMIHLREGLNAIRVVVHSPLMLHSALLWIDTHKEMAIYKDTIGEETDDEMIEILRASVTQLLELYIKTYTHYSFSSVSVMVPDVQPGDCENYGYCNAYVIKQVLDYKEGKMFDPSNIQEFAGQIERDYHSQLDPNLPVEVEYYHGRGGGGRGYGGSRGYRGGGGYGYRGRGGYGYGGAGGLGLGLGLLGGMAIGGLAASAAQPAYAYPYYPTPYPYPYY
jgi:hypothetical protein